MSRQQGGSSGKPRAHLPVPAAPSVTAAAITAAGIGNTGPEIAHLLTLNIHNELLLLLPLCF